MKRTTNQVGNAKYRTITKIVLTAAILTIGLAAVAPSAAAADPDIAPSGDACGTDAELGDATVGTVGGDDAGDWYATPGPRESLRYVPLTPNAGIQIEKYDSDCNLVSSFGCSLTTDGFCSPGSLVQSTVIRAVFGQVLFGLGGHTAEDGYLHITAVDGKETAYEVNTVMPIKWFSLIP